MKGNGFLKMSRYDRDAETHLVSLSLLACSLLTLFSIAQGQCKVENRARPDEPKSVLHILVSERLFSALNRTDAVASLKIWADLISCSQHLELDTKVQLVSDQGELRRRIVARAAQVLILDSVEFLALSDEDLVEGIGLPSSAGQLLAPEFVLLVDSKTDSLTQLRGKRIIFYLRTGSAASVAWISTLLSNQQLGDVQTFFLSQNTAETPNNCILPLFFGRADACVIDMRSWSVAREMNPQIAVKVKALTQSIPVIAGVVALTKAPVEHRAEVTQSLLNLHKQPVGQQILTIFRSGPMIAFRPEYCESTRRFWKEYESTLNAAQAKAWSRTLMPKMPVDSSGAGHETSSASPSRVGRR